MFKKSLEQLSDEALMQELAGGKTAACGVLYDRYGSRMYRYFYRMFWQNTSKAEDFTQELFLKIIEKSSAFDPKRSFCTWLYTLAANLCKNEYRRKKATEAEDQIPGILVERHGEQLDQHLFTQHLRRAIDQLSERHRQCFVLRYQEERSVAEIAEIVGCPEGTVKSRLHYALQQVSTQLEIWKTY
jgi:RNA polymerase sigma-70 factor (ECF subfamily)